MSTFAVVSLYRGFSYCYRLIFYSSSKFRKSSEKVENHSICNESLRIVSLNKIVDDFLYNLQLVKIKISNNKWAHYVTSIVYYLINCVFTLMFCLISSASLSYFLSLKLSCGIYICTILLLIINSIILLQLFLLLCALSFLLLLSLFMMISNDNYNHISL